MQGAVQAADEVRLPRHARCMPCVSRSDAGPPLPGCACHVSHGHILRPACKLLQLNCRGICGYHGLCTLAGAGQRQVFLHVCHRQMPSHESLSCRCEPLQQPTWLSKMAPPSVTAVLARNEEVVMEPVPAVLNKAPPLAAALLLCAATASAVRQGRVWQGCRHTLVVCCSTLGAQPVCTLCIAMVWRAP